MRQLSVVCAAAGIAVTAFAAVSPAEAAFHLIRYQDSGFCQILDDSLPIKFPSKSMAVSRPVPTFIAAMGVKDGLLRKGTCKF